MKLLCPQGPCWRTWRGAHLLGTLKERSGDGCLSLQGPIGEPGESVDWEFYRQLEGSGKGASFFVGALLGGLLSGEPEGHWEEGSGHRHHSPVSWGVRSLGTLRVS